MQTGSTWLRNFWQKLPGETPDIHDNLYLATVGFFVGLCAGVVVSLFRISSGWAYVTALRLTSAHSLPVILLLFLFALAAALIVGRLIKNPAIRFGGSAWIRSALKEGQPHAWKIILLPKFLGSWLVAAFGVSVGREGPSIQMGCATALGLKRFNNREKIEQRFFILGGCAAGLATIFSAPFSGICWVYEILRAKMTANLFIFMLSGSFGVYVASYCLFGLGPTLPLDSAVMPEAGKMWLLVPLGIISAAVGIAYNYLLRVAIRIYTSQKKVLLSFQPLFSFGLAALLLIIFPALTGEGFTIFAPIDQGRLTVAFLCLFLALKLLFTAWCYGSSIPAGVMVPLLCVGGVTGAIFSDCTVAMGLLGPECSTGCIALGMAGAFAAAERAPVTGLVLVAQTTGAYGVCLGMLLTAAIGTFLGRVLRVRAL